MAKKEKSWFPLFEKECSYWLSYFGMFDWRVSFHEDALPSGNVAETRMEHVAKVAYIMWNTAYPYEVNDEESVKRTAFHEACELLLGSLYHQATVNGVTDYHDDMISKAGHDIIRRLENTVYRDLTERRK